MKTINHLLIITLSKRIVILGSTGSIGTQALSILRNFESEFKVVGLTTNQNIELLQQQILDFDPEYVAVANVADGKKLKKIVTDREVFEGALGILDLIRISKADIVLNALVGFSGLKPTLEAIDQNQQVLLANKESMVVAGEFIKQKAREKKVKIIPVDSEHSAIFQCLSGYQNQDIEKIFLTCSGGPFWGKTKPELVEVTVEEALAHPKWQMGKKISIDSATLMNKGLELIEAIHLFDLNLEQIEVLIHRQSIVHSLVQFGDGNVLAQASLPDMRFPIAYALFYPHRQVIPQFPRLDLLNQSWTFTSLDRETFIAIDLAFTAIKKGRTFPTVLNTANEIAVRLFLERKISFLEITQFVAEQLAKHQDDQSFSMERVFEVDQMIRNKFKNFG